MTEPVVERSCPTNKRSRNTGLIDNSLKNKKLIYQCLFNSDISVFLYWKVVFDSFKFYKNDCEIQ